MFAVQFRFVLNGGNGHAAKGKSLGIIFLFAFLTDQQQRFVAGIKLRVLHCFLNKLGFAAFQHTHKEVTGNLFLRHVLLLYKSGVEQLFHLMFLQLGTDHAHLAGNIGAAGADLMLTGHHVELVPGVAAVHNALGTQYSAVLAGIQRGQDALQLVMAVLVGSLVAPAGEHFVCIVVMMMVMMAAAALAVMVVMVVLMLVLIIVVIMVVVVMAAFVAVVIILVMMVVMLVLILIIVVIIMVVVMVAALVAVLIMVMVVVMMLFLILVRMGSIGSLCFAQKLGNQVALTIHNGNDLCTGQFVPIGGHYPDLLSGR